MPGHTPWAEIRRARPFVSPYRGYVTIPGLPAAEHDDRHDRLIDVLEREHPELGPILGGTAEGVQVVLSTDALGPAKAAGEFVSAVADALHDAALGDLYPGAVEVEPVVEEPSPS